MVLHKLFADYSCYPFLSCLIVGVNFVCDLDIYETLQYSNGKCFVYFWSTI